MNLRELYQALSSQDAGREGRKEGVGRILALRACVVPGSSFLDAL
jgi:hypothetical protein